MGVPLPSKHSRSSVATCASAASQLSQLNNKSHTHIHTLHVQVLPLERGAGMEQLGMRKAEEVLGRGDWVHIFPEGTRTCDGRIAPARRGVARLISSCHQPPLGLPCSVLPDFHMESGSGSSRIFSANPRLGSKLAVLHAHDSRHVY